MTDTDKLKRLAEAVDLDHVSGIYMDGELVKYRDTILALITENERLKEANRKMFECSVDVVLQRDEAVALLRAIPPQIQTVSTKAFLARIEGEVK